MSIRRALLSAVLATTTIGSTLIGAATSAEAADTVPVGLASTIALDNCSGALVRYPTSVAGDRAMLLTNGHCYEGGFLDAGEVLVNTSSTRTGRVLDDAGSSLGTVRADRVLYATMTGTDVALYRLTETYGALASRTGATPRTIAATRPADATSIAIPSSYWKTTYSCAVDGFVDTLREGQWTWHDSIRYRFPDAGCETIHGTSGSPIVDTTTGQIVGINNTGNDDGGICTVNNPCEDTGDGTPEAVEGQNYGQQTYWFTTCLTATNAIDLTKAGCLLPS